MTDQERRTAPVIFHFVEELPDGSVRLYDPLSDDPGTFLTTEKYKIFQRLQPATFYIHVVPPDDD